MPAAIKFSNDQINDIVSNYGNKETTVSLGNKYGVDHKVIARVLKQNNINVTRQHYKVNGIMGLNLVQDYNNGLSYSALEQKYNLERECVAKTLKRFGGTSRVNLGIRKYKVDDSFFEKIDTEEKAYWLGFITTDGCVTNGNSRQFNTVVLHLANADKKHLEKFREALSSNYVIHYNKFNDSVYFNIVSSKMVKDLAKYGVVPRKTGKTYFPKGMIPENLLKHYWRGCIDGDGTIAFTSTNKCVLGLVGDVLLVNAFRDFCNDILPEIKIEDKYRLYRVVGKSGNYCQMYFSGRNAQTIVNYLYEGSNVFLERKKLLFELLSNKLTWLF